MNSTRRAQVGRGRLIGGIILVVWGGVGLPAGCDSVRGQQEESESAGQQGALLAPTASQPTASQPVVRTTDGELRWHRPRSQERREERDRLVDRYIAHTRSFSPAIRDQRVVQATRAVPRHKFVPAQRQGSAYDDTPLPIGHGQTISQPYIVALMTDLLELEPGQKVLEIGTGSGYQAAVLTELTPYVFSIEIVEPLCQQVVERFERLGYRTVKTKQADGYDGWAEHAPFDAIIVTCAAGHVPPPLWDQLKAGGRLVIPLGGVYDVQRLVVLTKQADGSRKSRDVLPVRFVPMTGKSQDR
jgi:protein-L-isoaspartate(D-aspartate) O-methyltransferase